MIFSNGSKITYGPQFRSYFDGQIAKLTITELSEETSGLVKCYANSQYGDAQSSGMVKLEHQGMISSTSNRIL